MLSVRSSSLDKVNVLDAGADDYLSKPFAADEFLARVRALVRRPQPIQSNPLQFHDLILDAQKFKVSRKNKNIKLTNKEFSLLQYLMLNAGQIIPRDVLLEHVWDGETDPFSNTLETHIMRLRQKIDQQKPKLIHNIASRGYKLDISA
jgi:DNA-binding response OmpR family regulator